MRPVRRPRAKVEQPMSTRAEQPPSSTEAGQRREIIGHPIGLWLLFGTEFWERFCYYGMRAILGPYVALAFFSQYGDQAASQASLTYGGYTSMVYMTSIIGGLAADRLLGYQRSIIAGGSLMVVGMLLLLVPTLSVFLLGLSFIIIGTGLLKPNVSTIVGKLYETSDPRRDSAFTIFYMGINLGSTFAPIICGAWIGATYGYIWGFAAAAIGMMLGLVMFASLRGLLGGVGQLETSRSPASVASITVLGCLALLVPVYLLLSQSDLLGTLLFFVAALIAVYFLVSGFRSGERVQRHRYIAMLILFAANIVFWSLFEQAGSSLNFFARDHVSAPFDFTVFQAVNPALILLLGPFYAMMWPRLDRLGLNPTLPVKFALGLFGVGIGYYILVYACQHLLGADVKVPWMALVLLYLAHTFGELFLSPIGLSMVTKLSRPQETGLAMGGWFLSIAIGNYFAGRISAVATAGPPDSIATYVHVFSQMVWLGCGTAVLLLVASPFIARLTHGMR